MPRLAWMRNEGVIAFVVALPFVTAAAIGTGVLLKAPQERAQSVLSRPLPTSTTSSAPTSSVTLTSAPTVTQRAAPSTVVKTRVVIAPAKTVVLTPSTTPERERDERDRDRDEDTTSEPPRP